MYPKNYIYTSGIKNGKPRPKRAAERNAQRDPTKWEQVNQKYQTHEEKCNYIERAVKQNLIFALKPWQAGKGSFKTMSKSWNFALVFYFASDWNPDTFKVTKFTKTSWQYVQCDICVCLFVI